MNFDPSKVQTVEKKMVRKAQDFDIKYDSEKQTFLISDNFIEKNGLSNNGLAFGVYPDGSLILSVQEDAKSSFYKRKTGSAKKTKSFKHSILSDRLLERNFTSGALPLEKVGEAEGVVYYKIVGSETGTVDNGDRHHSIQAEPVEDQAGVADFDQEDEFL